MLPPTDAESTMPGQKTSLAQRILAGDRLAEEELYNTYGRGVMVIAIARTRDREAARDLTQEVFIAVLQAVRAGQLREPEKLAAFVQGTARNLINNFLRSRVRRAECDLEAATEEPQASDLIAELESSERQRLVRREIDSLSPVDQQILLWSMVDGHSLAEIAIRLKMSHETVRTRKSRMVKKIGKKFAEASQKPPL